MAYLFQELPNEDEAVIKLHINILQEEMRKKNPDFQLCQRKMERTSSYRQRRRYNPEVSVSEILEEFPTLRHRNFVSSFVFNLFLFFLFFFHTVHFNFVVKMTSGDQ